MRTNRFDFKDCYASYDGKQLIVGNRAIERRWKAEDGFPVSLSLRNPADGTEWLAAEGEVPACGLPLLAGRPSGELRFRAAADDDLGIAPQHLKAELELTGGALEWKLEFRVYPSAPLVRQRLWVRQAAGGKPESPAALAGGSGSPAGGGPQAAAARPVPAAPGGIAAAESSGAPAALQADGNAAIAAAGAAVAGDYLDSLPLAELHCRWRAVELRDVTDTNNNLTSFEDGLLYVNDRRKVRGNLLICRQTLRDAGLLLIKEGPTPFGHLRYPGGDFEFAGRRVRTIGGGVGASDLRDGEWIPAYGTAVAVGGGDDYAIAMLLHSYHGCLRRWNPPRDSFVMCNNWGDRSRDGRVSESFIAAELARAADIGITNYQIDDGWQKGNTTNSVNPAGGRWSGYYEGRDDFWDVHPERFPQGLEPVAEEARRLGVRIALWFSPDSADDFAHWREDAERLLELHRLYGIAYFKLDGVKIKSKYGETNFVRMMETVVRETAGAVVFNLDATNEVRLGYYGRTQYGVLFLENRYTDFRSYYPHWSLRNLWQLAKYVPARKLQIELLNVERNKHKYGDDPLAPAVCGTGYSFAVALFANPLVWMETTGLDEESAGVLRAMLAVYNGHRQAILGGCVLPVGAEPDGTQWTGFQSVTAEREGYLLVFRERNPAAQGEFRLWNAPAGARLRLVCLMRMEERNRVWTSDVTNAVEEKLPTPAGTYAFELGSPFSFALYKYDWTGGEPRP